MREVKKGGPGWKCGNDESREETYTYTGTTALQKIQTGVINETGQY